MKESCGEWAGKEGKVPEKGAYCQRLVSLRRQERREPGVDVEPSDLGK